MATSKDFKDYVLEFMPYVNARYMMGEYLLYFEGKLFGGIYDNRLMVKKTDANAHYGLNEGIPYKNAKRMYIVEDFENAEKIFEIIKDTVGFEK